MGDNAQVGTGGTWEPLVISTEFCCESQTALKHKVVLFFFQKTKEPRGPEFWGKVFMERKGPK